MLVASAWAPSSGEGGGGDHHHARNPMCLLDFLPFYLPLSAEGRSAMLLYKKHVCNTFPGKPGPSSSSRARTTSVQEKRMTTRSAGNNQAPETRPWDRRPPCWGQLAASMSI